MKTPQQQGKSSRTKGARVEREIVTLLQNFGIPAEKLSRSGYTGPDVQIADEFTGEVKARKTGEGFKTIQNWKSGVDILFLKSNHNTPMVVLDFSLFVKLIQSYLRN